MNYNLRNTVISMLIWNPLSKWNKGAIGLTWLGFLGCKKQFLQLYGKVPRQESNFVAYIYFFYSMFLTKAQSIEKFEIE